LPTSATQNRRIGWRAGERVLASDECPGRSRALGVVHPPVGTVQFVGCAIANISIGEATKTAWPYYLAIFIAITLVTYVPAFSTWLPSLITGHPVL
jgi:hypothetical protein